MESIQLAQMLADLSDLNAAVRREPFVCDAYIRVTDALPQQESQAALALVNANKTSTTTSASSESTKPSEHLHSRPDLRHHQRRGSAGSAGSGSFISRTASPAKFDKYGRRILTPPNTRTNSAYGSIPGTPRRDAEVSTIILISFTPVIFLSMNQVLKRARWRDQQIEEDVERANSLMALYEIRAKLKDQDNRSLNKLREKIDALHARQQAEKRDGDSGRMRLSYPKGC